MKDQAAVERLYQVRNALGLKNNGALQLVLMALEHYQGQCEQFPAKIAQAAKDTLTGFQATAEDTARAAAEAAKADLAAAVATAAHRVADQVAGTRELRWGGGSVPGSRGADRVRAGVRVLHGERRPGLGLGGGETAAWANTPQGKAAYQLAQAGSIDTLTRCDLPGWRIEKGACYPDQALRGKLHGWRLKPDASARAGPVTQSREQMGTDRTEIYSSTCPCGHGEIVINSCTPDHGWPTRSKWIEMNILCQDCSRQYLLIAQNQYYVIVKKSDYKIAHDVAEVLEKDIGSILQALQTLPETRALALKFAELLEDQGSMAARHRLLMSSRLEHSSIATFRKQWTGSTDWVRENLNVSNLGKVMDALNARDERISAKLQAVENLEKQRNDVLRSPLPVVGEPLAKVNGTG